MLSKVKGYLPYIAVCLAFLAVQMIAILLTRVPNASAEPIFSDPGQTANIFQIIGMMIVASLGMLLLVYVKLKRTLFGVFFVLVSLGIIFTISLMTENLWIIGACSAILIIAMLVRPEWYVLDSIALLIAIGVATIMGSSLSIIPVMIMLSLLAVYDFIAVYKTKHMIGVAKASVDARLPLFLVIPLVKGYSFIREGFKKFEKGEDSPSGERRAMFIGTGDFGFPPVMAISANVFVIAPKYFGLINLPAAMAIIGSLVGMALIVFPHGDKFRPGLPLLNGGAMLGFIIGIFALMFGVVR